MLAVPVFGLAQGSPPIITDDPGTPGDGHWEINVGIGTERRDGVRRSEQPRIELLYGIGDRLQLLYGVSYLRQGEEFFDRASGLGNSVAGVKWRWHDGGKKGLSVSLHPQVDFNTPGSSAGERGLADHGTTFILPFQFERTAGPVVFIGEVGREFCSGGDTWLLGLSAGRQCSRTVAVAVELVGGAAAGLDRSSLTANLAAAVDLSESVSIMISVGRELHNHDEPRAGLVGYLGLQWRR